MASIRRLKSGKWQVQIRAVGLRPLARSFAIKASAKKWARQIETQISQGDLGAGLDILRKTTLASLIERYRDTITVLKKSQLSETVLINSLLRHPFTGLNLAALTPQHFADYRDLRAKTVKASTINHDLAILNQVYRLARAEWAIPVINPLAGLRRPKADRSRDRRLMPGELARLMDAAQKCRNKHIRPMVQFAIETAMRRSEILAILWADIDHDRRTLHIPLTKTGNPRTIPLTANALAILAKQDCPRPFPMSVESFHMAWKRLIKRSGITDLHFHDLRHEAITRFFEVGLSVPEVALISGHKDYRMLARYTHLRPEDVANKLWAGSQPSPDAPVTSHQPVARANNVIALTRTAK